MSMQTQNDLTKARIRSVFLAVLMVFSTTLAFTTTASASVARTYTTNRDPVDIAIADFNCDGHNDMAIATEGTHTLSVLWNDGNGDFSERQDIWVSANSSRNADWDEFANVEQVEVGEFNGDNAPDIVIYQKNNPFKTNDQGAPAGDPGNVTIIENDGCNNKDFTIGQRFTHFWVWDMSVGDADQDGNDDIFVLELEEDLSRQNVVSYRSPITSSTQGAPTFLGPSTTFTYRTLEVGDYGETQTVGLGGSCTDDDIFLLRTEGLDYTTGSTTNPGNGDNVTIVEYSCTGVSSTPGAYPTDITTSNPTVIQFGVPFSEGFAIADIGGSGYVDTIAMMDGNLENVTYKSASAQGVFGPSQMAYFGPYISWSIAVEDLNGDSQPDFINPTIAYQVNTSDSSGGSTSNFFLSFPTSVQVTLSDGNGGHVSPLSYTAGRRPSSVAVGQLQGASTSAPDLVVGHTQFNFNGWRDNFGWEGQYDTITVVEMDNRDLAVTDLTVDPVDRFFGIVGEGTRTFNVTVTNTGMDTLNGQTADLEVELKVVDQANSTNTTVYANDWDSAPVSNCGTGCTWAFEEYIDQATNWHLETNSSTGASDGNNDENVSANYLNPTDFMWAGNMVTNASGDTWSGYGNNWDDAMVLENVDLTGADRAFMDVELFRHLGLGALGNLDGQGGFIVGDVWDDLAIVEIGSAESGWNVIGCPQRAALEGACPNGVSVWGGFDTDRGFKQNFYGADAENIVYYGLAASGTFYGWDNFTAEDLGSFDLSPWAGETVDVRFRFRTGFEGSTSNANESQWSGRDGFAVDNLTISKQNTVFLPNPQVQSTTITLNNLQPGQEYTTAIQANVLNDTTYRISATLSNNNWDQQPINDDAIGYVTPLNLYDPAVESIEYFEPGSLYAEGIFDIEVVTNNWGNTPVDFDVEATVYSATPSDVYCGTPSAVCVETFEGGTQGTRYQENQNALGAIYNEDTCSTKVFNNNAYWFGHPCDTSTLGYDDAWANQTLSIPEIDLTGQNGDFVSLNFEYYADTFYTIDQNGNIDPSDYVTMTVDYANGGQNYNGLVYAQWNDYNEDGTCQNDDDGNGFINATESIDVTELDYIGDPATQEGTDGNYNVFFNSDELVKTTSIDLTHLYIQNRSSADSFLWTNECLSLQGSTVNVNFTFQSDDDGRNGINDGFKGVGFNNITLQQYTFVEDATYTTTRTNVDAEDALATTIGSHEFVSGVYRLDVRTLFDNTTAGTAWYNNEELSEANNVARVIFNVESVDISIGRPDTLACHSDQTLACVLPIDSALTHDWEFAATNGVLGGDYVFFMDVHDMADGSLAHQVTAGAARPLESQERTQVSFTPWNGWMDGHTYNISFYAQLADGSDTGNVRFFHASFANTVDVAILSDTSVRTAAIKQDLALLNMTYTQFEINDWDTYFDAGWFTHYNKIVLPWQDTLSARDTQFGGDGYYQYIGEPARRTILENFMSAGGTVQAHLGPLGEQVYGLNDNLPGRLPFGLDIKSRDTANSQVTFATMDLADPFHPLMDGVDTTSFQGFDADAGVAQAVLNTQSVSSNNVPNACNGYMEDGGFFQRLIRYTEDIQDTVLGVCSYYSGGLIVSTIDVSTHSERADSTTFPLLGNMLEYHVDPYPQGFGTLGNGLDMTINGVTPDIDPSTGDYALRFMKSNAALEFSYTTDTTETLSADWIIQGPTGWNGNSLANGATDHTMETSPNMTFCKIDLASQTGCGQGERWSVTLMLHDDNGHARTINVTVETNDVYADEFRPEAAATIDMRTEYEDNVQYIGTKTVSGQEWDVNRIILQGEGDDAELVINFDASNSSDRDALEGDPSSGIETYQWKVLFDAPYGDDSFDLDGHTFTQTSASQGAWSYRFQNVTVDDTGTTENQIRIELVVYDSAGKLSERHRMYFVVVPEGFGDAEPVVQWEQVNLNSSRVDTDTITISGTVLSGAEDGDVSVEAAFDEAAFGASSVMKYNLSELDLWGKSTDLGDNDNFEITLSLSSLYTNTSTAQRVFIKYYEGDFPNERWVTIKWIEINLPACQGLEPNPDAEAAGGEFILDANGDCQWDGAWTYDPVTGEWSAPSDGADNTQGEGQGLDSTVVIAAGVGLLVLILVSLMFARRGDEKEDAFAGMEGGFGAMALDPTEQYVQQLIAQGYPEETARSFAAQYVGGGQAAAQPAAQAAQPAAAGYDQAIYEQYYQQFVGQGYDAATAAAYAQQYAVQYAQSQQ